MNQISSGSDIDHLLFFHIVARFVKTEPQAYILFSLKEEENYNTFQTGWQ